MLATAEDLDMYDRQYLSSLTSKRIVGFVVSTFGEGDPTDNAVGFYDYLMNLQDATKANPTRKLLSNLHYFAFGLGSSKYQHYNRFVDVVDRTLAGAGAQRLGSVGKADETLRSDSNWRVWKEDILGRLGDSLNRKQIRPQQSVYEAEIELVEVPEKVGKLDAVDMELYNSQSKAGRGRVYAAPICQSRKLTGDVMQSSSFDITLPRTYLHVEFGQERGDTLFTYESGDHIAVWPINPYEEVQRLVRLFGWDKRKLHDVINIRPIATSDTQPTIHTPFSAATTREILLTNCLDICGPVSRETVSLLAHFSPNSTAKYTLENVIKNDDSWATESASNFWTIGRLMQFAEPKFTAVWPPDLFTLLVQSLPKLQPRYFSIASSPRISPHRIAITVGVVVEQIAGTQDRFYGLTTNYLNSLHRQFQNGSEDTTFTAIDRSDLPIATSEPSNVLIRIHASTFRLPFDICRPIIMVGAGSGIAPFRAFIQERASLATEGFTIGPMLLFFGCRSASEDFLYADEWADYKSKHTFLKIDCAFSRDGKQKVYVQDRLRLKSKEVRRLVTEQGAAFYICGSTKMASEVKDVLVENLIDFERDNENSMGYINQMKKDGLLQEDTWT